MTRTRLISLMMLLMIGPASLAAQEFDPDAYRQFLETNTSLTSEGLQQMHPVEPFNATAKVEFAKALYADSIDKYYALTPYERSLVSRNGFMVTERVGAETFGDLFLDIYKKDLPVFISTDAILHAMHMSYDAILRDIEIGYLSTRVDSLLTMLHGQLPALDARYASTPEMKPMLRDLDLYLTVPRRLFGEEFASPYFAENAKAIDSLLMFVEKQAPTAYPLFASVPRTIDFSQFTPRGHYTQSEELTRYFQAMMWLGRTELYLMAPVSADVPVPEQDIRRQTIDAALLVDAARGARAFDLLGEIDTMIRTLVGDQDNVTLPNVASLMDESGIDRAGNLLQQKSYDVFKQALADKPYAFQRINSQILMSNPYDPEQIRPASALMLLGQRFIVDSYVTGNVVYDRIVVDGTKVRRMLPSSLDVLFALGNNAAAQFLKDDLDRYRYAPNLAGLRYLIDSYDDGFWSGTLYNAWLNAIRTLNPPQKRDRLPRFMQTSAWWQEKMNTQLASWAQLRHDNLLYAKQSYSGGITCTYPYAFVEPIPEFYRAVRAFADKGSKGLQAMGFTATSKPVAYFGQMGRIMDTLTSIAEKHLADEQLSEDEVRFLKTVLFEQTVGCGERAFTGWYARLHYTGTEGIQEKNMVVADIHTAPTDDQGNMVGWVVHVGTGPINLAVVTCRLPDGRPIAFAGPVMSYYEHTTTGFRRLTDETWSDGLYEQAPSMRPALVNAYLANGNGESRGEVVTLQSVAEPVSSSPETPVVADIEIRVYPNPFATTTTITFAIPPSSAHEDVELAIFDMNGQPVRRLISHELPAGAYSSQWDGLADNGSKAAEGAYLYRLTVGERTTSGTVTLLRKQ